MMIADGDQAMDHVADRDQAENLEGLREAPATWPCCGLPAHAILDALPQGVIVLSAGRRIVASNLSAHKLLSIDADRLWAGNDFAGEIEKACADGIVKIAADVLERSLDATVNEPGLVEVDQPDGRRWLQMAATHTAFGQIIISLSDITEFRDRETLLSDRGDRLADEGEDLKELAQRLGAARTEATASLRRAEQANQALSREIAERRALEHELRRMANTDELTGVLNRRRFVELLEHEVERARRYQRSLAMLMLDVDHFKSVNDRFGHGAGDEALRHFAGVGSDSLRDADLFARLGGEEFAALLPETPLERALIVAQRLRLAVAVMPCRWEGATINLTVSVGVAILHAVDNPALGILGRADRALYAAKASGRDRVAYVLGRDEPIIAPRDDKALSALID